MKNPKIKNAKKKIELVMALVIITASFFLARQGAAFVSSRNVTTQKPCIVIDAGHGGGNLRQITSRRIPPL